MSTSYHQHNGHAEYQAERQNGAHDAKSWDQHPEDRASLREKIQEHISSAGVHGAKAEQAYWDSFNKARAADHLPPVTFDGNSYQGHQTHASDQFGNTIYDSKPSAHEGRGQGPYAVFRNQGMSNDEAMKAAERLESATGRNKFVYREGDQFKENPDKSWTVSHKNRDGSSEEATYDNGKLQKKVVHNGDQTIETTHDAGLGTTTTTYSRKGKGSETIVHKDSDGANTDHDVKTFRDKEGHRLFTEDGKMRTQEQMREHAKGEAQAAESMLAKYGRGYEANKMLTENGIADLLNKTDLPAEDRRVLSLMASQFEKMRDHDPRMSGARVVDKQGVMGWLSEEEKRINSLDYRGRD